MIHNSKIAGKVINDKLFTALLSIATSGIIGCFAFLWQVNGALARLEERDTENIRAREEVMIKTNNIQLDLRDVRERLITLETKNQRP